MVPSVRSSTPLTRELRDWLELRLGGALELPILPEVASRVVAMCDDENTGAPDVKRALEDDPSLASNFLRVANSALYAAREPIVSLQQAIHRLGLRTTRTIALTAALRGRVFTVPVESGHDERVRAIWQHSVVAATFAREVARKLRSSVEGAFLCALLHDVGRPIVLQAVLAAPDSVAQKPLAPDVLDAAIEEFHAVVGGRAVQAWKLADWTVAAVAHHHDPSNAAPFEDEARLVRLADLLSHWALGDGARSEDFPMSDPVIEELDLYREDVEALLAMRSTVLDKLKTMP
jgi:putative nucleotidyltransferase with HDIG domain